MIEKEIIEIARRILNDAVKANLSQEIVLRASEKLDSYIAEFYKNNQEMQGKNKKDDL